MSQVHPGPDTAFLAASDSGRTESNPPPSPTSSTSTTSSPSAMSGGGEVRVLLQEAGQESPRMPAWKREILERRKAKTGVSGAAATAETAPPGGAAPQRANGELTGSVNGGGGARSDGGGASGGSGRNYTISTATQHFAHNKEPRPMATERSVSREDDIQESLVLQESLGPLEENPFIKLEKERRRRQDQENTSRPVQHILELYGSVPGIRTIRAENIIIIESDPDYFQEGKGGSRWQQNGVSGYSSLNDLLDRRGSAVTEIRAKEVVIYDTTLSKSEENLSTLGRPDRDVSSYETGEGQGRVSRMLQKFDSNYGKLQKKSHSTENLLDLDCGSSSSSRQRPWIKSQPDLVPKPRRGPSVSSPGGSQPSSPVFQSPWSPRAKSQPAPLSPLGSPKHLPGSPQSVYSFRQRFGDSGAASSPRDEPDSRGPTKLTKEKEWESTDVFPKAKVPCSPETLRTRAESSASSVSYKVSGDYEIRPAPKPDLTEIPDGDIQARALANLRLQSKNSFTVIPKRQLSASPTGGSPTPSSPVKGSSSHKAAEVPSPGVPTPRNAVSSPDALKRLEEKKVKTPARPSEPKSSPSFPRSSSPSRTSQSFPASPLTQVPTAPPAVSPPSSSPAVPTSTPSPGLKSPAPVLSPPAPEQPPVDHLPVTNIDDIEVEPPRHDNAPAPSPVASRRTGNTFTVVPKRRTEPAGQTDSPESQPDGPSKVPPGSTPPQAPYSQLGTLIKKRYPAVDEIEVIGGYLSLERSCLFKAGSTGKKVRALLLFFFAVLSTGFALR